MQVWYLDQTDHENVKECIRRCADKLERIDAVVLNAGILTPMFRKVGGHESTITTNVILTFLMTQKLFPKLKQTAKLFGIIPRLIIVTTTYIM